MPNQVQDFPADDSCVVLRRSGAVFERTAMDVKLQRFAVAKRNIKRSTCHDGNLKTHNEKWKYFFCFWGNYSPSNSAGPTPTMMIDIGRLAACRENGAHNQNSKGCTEGYLGTGWEMARFSHLKFHVTPFRWRRGYSHWPQLPWSAPCRRSPRLWSWARQNTESRP